MSARIPLSVSLPMIALALGGAGCDEALKSVSLIEETRVLGARVEVESDPSRSSPNPGERASRRRFVVAPSGQPSFSYALSVCAVRVVNNGFPPCASAPFASAVQTQASNAEARLDFQVPAELDLEATPHAFASGMICPDADLNLGPDDAPTCANGKGRDVAFEFELGGPERSNLNPSFAADALSLDGEPWPDDDERAACDVGSLRLVKQKTRHTLAVSLADSNFEALTQPTPIDPSRETLLVSPFSSAGKLSNGFLSLSADPPPEARQVSWDAPASEAELPRLVRFYFVVRDGRGGEDFATRALCAVP